jgi:hypothetical protein
MEEEPYSKQFTSLWSFPTGIAALQRPTINTIHSFPSDTLGGKSHERISRASPLHWLKIRLEGELVALTGM